MKDFRFGQATPLDGKSFRRLYDGFLRDDHKLFLAVLWYTGERPGAVLKMKVEQFYSDPLRRQVRSRIVFPAPVRKGKKKTREVPCSRRLELLLRAYQPPASGYLFPSPVNSGQPITMRAMDKAFRRALARGGMENQGYGLYSARRGFITELHRAGYGIRVIQALTGHSSLSVLGRYIEVSEQQQQSAIDSLD